MQKEKQKTFAIYTLGCKVNQYESQNIREQFESANYKEVKFPEKADIYIINTCVVTSKSEKKSNYILKRLKNNNPGCFIIVTGCLVSGENSFNKLEFADKVISNKDKDKIINIIKENSNTKCKKFISYFSVHKRAFVKIQDGCDSFCSYCIIPYVRGHIVSRKLEDIYDEINALSLNEYKEIVLTGIHIGKYGKDNNSSIIDILKYIEKTEKILRVRLSSFEPKEISSELIDFIKNSEKICKHFHIPLQSGDNDILKSMNRNYTRHEYLEIINKIKNSISDISISTDIIVGFPDESEEKFNNTLKMVEEIGFSRAHIFPYSDRPKTKAYLLKPKVSHAVKKERSLCLEAEVKETSRKYKEKFIGKNVPVLIEDIKKDNLGFYGQGYSDKYILTKIKNNNIKVNTIYNAKIIEIEDDGLIGV